MPDILIPLILLGIACLACGPIALIVSLIALKRTQVPHQPPPRPIRPPGPVPKPQVRTAPVTVEKEEDLPVATLLPPKPPAPLQPVTESAEDVSRVKQYSQIHKPPAPTPAPEPVTEKPRVLLEQRIGTKWLLIAGVITTFFGVALFLRYAYTHFEISDSVKIAIAAAGGFVALIAGEVTRRRGYEIVAKGVTALGFAILYLTVFCAQLMYGLIESRTSFLLAALITAATMIYAVVLDEVLIAFLSLLGGFLTPVIVSTGENLPNPLFIYVAVLSVGAMACGCYRKWRTINFLAFIGTFFLYTRWFETFYRPTMHDAAVPEQMAVAIGWLAAFFIVYLVMPVFYELLKETKARKEDVLLILANALVVLYYLCVTLLADHRSALALACVGCCAAHLGMMAAARWRCREDMNLHQVLLAIALLFLTIAVPLYFKMNASVIAWSMQAVILTVIGLRYKSVLTQIGGGVALVLACCRLLLSLPMHPGAFRLIFNETFGTYCCVVAAAFVCHFLYRRLAKSPDDDCGAIAQLLYCAAAVLLFAAATMEWYYHCRYNLTDSTSYIWRGQLILLAAAVGLLIARPLCPPGRICEALGMASVAAGTVFVGVFFAVAMHKDSFAVFANPDFLAVLVFALAVLACHIKYRLLAESGTDSHRSIALSTYVVLGLLLFFAFAAEWYWHCVHNLKLEGMNAPLARGEIIIFSAAVLLFIIRPICPNSWESKAVSWWLSVAGAVFTLTSFAVTHETSYMIFVNPDFIVAFLFVATVFASAWMLRTQSEQGSYERKLAIAFVMSAIFVLWALLNEEIYLFWYCRNQYHEPLPNWDFRAHMNISVMWAIYGAVLMVIGFWKNYRPLRFIAIALFGLLLAKVFLWDTRKVAGISRIAAFLATGIALVGISYLYQFGKKKGFFDAMLNDKPEQ